MTGLLPKMTALTAKEFSRDILGMFFSFGFPLFFLVLFSVSSKPKPIPPISVGVIAEARDPAVARLIDTMTKQATLSVRVVSPVDAERTLRNGTVQALVYLAAQNGGPPGVRTVQSRPANIYLSAAIEASMAQASTTAPVPAPPSITEDFMDEESANAFAYITDSTPSRPPRSCAPPGREVASRETGCCARATANFRHSPSTRTPDRAG